jgi:hypothetical protein
VPETLDAQMIADARPLFDHGEKMQLHYNVQNTHRAIGTRISSLIVRQFGMAKLAPEHLTVRLRGSAGQSLGAFAVQGLKLEVLGDANDYVGKGLSGATIVVRRSPSSNWCRTRTPSSATRCCMARRRGAVRRRAGGRALCRAQFGCHGGGGRLRVERLRIHDRRHPWSFWVRRATISAPVSPAAWPSSMTRTARSSSGSTPIRCCGTG